MIPYFFSPPFLFFISFCLSLSPFLAWNFPSKQGREFCCTNRKQSRASKTRHNRGPTHCGPEKPRIQTYVLGHSLVRSLVRLHCSLLCLLRTACFPRALICLLAHSLTPEWMIRRLNTTWFCSTVQRSSKVSLTIYMYGNKMRNPSKDGGGGRGGGWVGEWWTNQPLSKQGLSPRVACTHIYKSPCRAFKMLKNKKKAKGDRTNRPQTTDTVTNRFACTWLKRSSLTLIF